MKKYKVGLLVTHPIQYYVPWYRALAQSMELDLHVYFACRQTPRGQAQAGFGVPFEWDVPLLDGYSHSFLENQSRAPDVSTFGGCHTPQIKNLIAQERFDVFIVQGWNTRSYWQAITACWWSGTPLLVRGDSQLDTERSLFKCWLKWGFYRWFIPRFDGYLVVGERAKAYFLHYGAKATKMFSVPHCVDNRFFRERREQLKIDRQKQRKEWGIPEQAVIFLFVGKLLPRKKPLDYLKALETVLAWNPNIFALMVGDGPLRASLETYAFQAKIPFRCVGFLNQTELPKAYAISDALVLPSEGSETWGMVVNEAMASGLPAVVSDKAGCAPDLIRSGVTGETYPCGDIHALAQILKRWSFEPEHLATMGTQAQQHMARYSVEVALDGTLRAVQSITKRSKKTFS